MNILQITAIPCKRNRPEENGNCYFLNIYILAKGQYSNKTMGKIFKPFGILSARGKFKFENYAKKEGRRQKYEKKD